jgi:putative redox protein
MKQCILLGASPSILRGKEVIHNEWRFKRAINILPSQSIDTEKYKIPGGNTMAKMKTISISAKLDEKFKVEVKAGDRIIYVDQPKAAGGSDEGPNPLEYFFTSLAGCIATAARIIANQKKIKLNGMDMKIEGDFDTEILLGKSTENRAGMTGIKVTLNMDSDISKKEKEAFIHEIENRCPVSDNIANMTPLMMEVV